MTTNNFLFAQLQPFSLAGAGAITGATAIILSSMQTIDGGEVTMADFGAIGYGTLEPGNGELEEQISFTGITQNTNGTATLTGVKNVLMIYPYTEASGTTKTHAGATTFVISNTSGFYNKLVSKDDDATITGKYTFPGGGNASAPVSGTVYAAPTDDLEYASKKYVDEVAVFGAPDANTTTKGIVQIATQAQVDAKTATGSTGASIVPTPALARSTLLSDYVVDTGSANNYAITVSPTVSSLIAGQRFSFKIANTNTGTSLLLVNGLTGTGIFKNDGATVLVAGDLVAGEVVEVECKTPAGFMLMVPPIKGLVPAQANNAGKFLTTDQTTASWGYPFDYQSFTGSGTWTKPSNLTGNEFVVVQVWGAGGGGAGVTNGLSEAGGGGGGGGFTQEWYRVSDLGSTVTVTIGAGGTAGTAGNPGGTGGTTTFGSLVSATGGTGGLVGSDGVAGVGSAGGNGSLGFGTSVYAGGAGGPANTVGTQSTYGGGGGGGGRLSGNGGAGAAAYFGGAGGGGGSASAGTGGAGGAAKTGYGGAGGSGGTAGNGNASVALAGGGGGGATNAGAGFTGGAGFRGECRVWCFL